MEYMKYYNTNTKECYGTPEECEEANKAYLVKVEEENKKVEADKKEKKELAANIETADKELQSAYDEFEKVKAKAAKILEDSNKQVEDMLESARKNIKEAENHKCECIKKFNEKFGTYKVYYSGERAEQEFNNALKWIDWLFRW